MEKNVNSRSMNDSLKNNIDNNNLKIDNLFKLVEISRDAYDVTISHIWKLHFGTWSGLAIISAFVINQRLNFQSNNLQCKEFIYLLFFFFIFFYLYIKSDYSLFKKCAEEDSRMRFYLKLIINEINIQYDNENCVDIKVDLDENQKDLLIKIYKWTYSDKYLSGHLKFITTEFSFKNRQQYFKNNIYLYIKSNILQILITFILLLFTIITLYKFLRLV